MQRQISILIFFSALIFFTLLAYYGAQINLWSSIILAILISLIIMNVFYPPSNIPIDAADYTLVIYTMIEIISILLLIIYILCCTLCDERTEGPCNICDHK